MVFRVAFEGVGTGDAFLRGKPDYQKEDTQNARTLSQSGFQRKNITSLLYI